MSATKLSENQCKHIESPSLKVALQTSGVASNFPIYILNGPVEYMGMGGNSLYQTKCTKHIRILLDHGEAKKITGKQLISIVERHKMKIGTGSSLFSNSYNIFKHCTANTWVAHTWKYMW